MSSGELYAWGLGTTGCLGLGDTQSRHSPTPVTAAGLPAFASVSCTKVRYTAHVGTLDAVAVHGVPC